MVWCGLWFNDVLFRVRTAAGSDQEEDGNVSLAQRKRFTRVEMARVLMERNQVRYDLE